MYKKEARPPPSHLASSLDIWHISKPRDGFIFYIFTLSCLPVLLLFKPIYHVVPIDPCRTSVNKSGKNYSLFLTNIWYSVSASLNEWLHREGPDYIREEDEFNRKDIKY